MTVSLGEATLILKDRADMALTHWSLPALVRIGSGDDPAIYAPGPEDDERLELTDPDMIAALETIRRAVARSAPKRGRLRLLGFAVGIAATVGGLVLWLPDALVDHTARALPESTRQDIARRLVIALEPHMGRPCRDLAGRRALEDLRTRLFGAAPWQARVVESGRGVLALPGGLLVIGGDLLTRPDGPATVAGHLLAASARGSLHDPMVWILERAGTSATFTLLTTGQISDAVLRDAAQGFALGADLRLDDPDPVLDRFRAAGISSRPYGLTADPAGEAWLPMIEADPFPAGGPEPVLSDAAWLRLQGICD